MKLKPAPTHWHRNLPALVSRGGIVLMLCCYLASFVPSPAGAPHHHHGEVHQHDTCQKDACHIAIYHPGSKGACQHKFHFSKAEEECSYCHSVMPRQMVTHPFLFEIAFVELQAIPVHDLQAIAIPQTDLPSDRGPPSVM